GAYLRAAAAPEELRQSIVRSGEALSRPTELLGFVVLAQRTQHVGEHAGDRRQEAALAHLLERLVARAERPRRRGGVARQHLDDECLLRSVRGVNVEPELAQCSAPGCEQFSRKLEP